MHAAKILIPLTQRRAAPWLAAGLTLALLWALGASYVIVFHDDVLAGFVARQGAMRDAYELSLIHILGAARSNPGGAQAPEGLSPWVTALRA